jgi:hypothetical protein
MRIFKFIQSGTNDKALYQVKKQGPFSLEIQSIYLSAFQKLQTNE